MSKFGLDDLPEESNKASTLAFSDRLAAFPSDRKRHVIDIAASDAAAAPLGFTSREAVPPIQGPAHGRRRRAVPAEPTRHLAIRLVSSQYDRFVAYADRHQLTYHDAIVRLMDEANESC